MIIKRICPYCAGRAFIEDVVHYVQFPCKACNGTGWIETRLATPPAQSRAA